MAGDAAAKQLSHLPNSMLRFTVEKASETVGCRLGALSFPGRSTIKLPNFIGNTSRGTVPHLTQDNLRKNTSLQGLYVALEDFIERAPQKIPSIYEYKPPDGEVLRRFIALQDDSLLIMGARRALPVACPGSNTNAAMQIYTSVGFRQLPFAHYTSAVKHMKPDVVVALSDIPSSPSPSRKRKAKMADRTAEWVKDLVEGRKSFQSTTGDSSCSIFAPILPIESELQRWYLDQLVDDMVQDIAGLAIYDAHSLSELPPALAHLPRLSLDNPQSPKQILQDISLGMDVFVVPFIGVATDAGIALDFSFGALKSDNQVSQRQPLGIDMWTTSHSTDMSPLRAGCKCYTCKTHQRAYLQHLLVAKEMLGWVLLQIHNHHILDQFFQAVRTSIENNTFEEERERFEAFYEPELPEQTGQGPRVRGYEFKNEGPAPKKKNPVAFKMLQSLDSDFTNSSGVEAPNSDTTTLVERR